MHYTLLNEENNSITFVVLHTWSAFFGSNKEGHYHCDDCYLVSGLLLQIQVSPSPATIFLISFCWFLHINASQKSQTSDFLPLCQESRDKPG
jgi:hypothetical protein